MIVDFSSYPVGTEVTLLNEHGVGGTARVMRFVVARRGTEESHIPSELTNFRPLSRSEATAEREFVFVRGGAQHNGITLWTINGEPFEPDHIAAYPKLGAVELWRVRALNVEHPIHVHLAPFQVLTSGGGRVPRPYNPGWKDTVSLDSGGEAEFLVRFDGYRGKYVSHCHNLEHEDMAMRSNFEVI